MFTLTHNENGFMAVLFKTIGFGVTYVSKDEEKSFTITFKLMKAHAMFSFALI